MNIQWSESTNKSEEKLEQDFDMAFKTIFRISKCFQTNKKKLVIYFSPEQGRSNFETNCMSKSTNIIRQRQRQQPLFLKNLGIN
jgi:hypothetical protein